MSLYAKTHVCLFSFNMRAVKKIIFLQLFGNVSKESSVMSFIWIYSLLQFFFSYFMPHLIFEWEMLLSFSYFPFVQFLVIEWDIEFTFTGWMGAWWDVVLFWLWKLRFMDCWMCFGWKFNHEKWECCLSVSKLLKLIENLII